MNRDELLEEPIKIPTDPNNTRIFKEKLFCDIKIESEDGVVFDAHKSFLTVASPVFEAMLKHDTEEARNSFVKVKDVKSKALKELIRFIYTGKIKNERENAREVLTAADKYQIEGLKTLCCESLVKDVTSENAVDMILTADHMNNDALFQRGMDFVAT